jgi:hypothetical protein
VVKDYNKVIRNISVAIAGIFEKCGNLTQQDAPHKKISLASGAVWIRMPAITQS